MSLNIFEKFNTTSICKICGTNKDGKSVLIPINGTKNDGIVECEQVHLDCLDLRCILTEDETTYYIVQSFPAKNKT